MICQCDVCGRQSIHRFNIQNLMRTALQVHETKRVERWQSKKTGESVARTGFTIKYSIWFYALNYPSFSTPFFSLSLFLNQHDLMFILIVMLCTNSWGKAQTNKNLHMHQRQLPKKNLVDFFIAPITNTHQSTQPNERIGEKKYNCEKDLELNRFI